MVFINFKMRMKIESLFIEWCEKNGIAKEPNSMVVFMIEKEWLNEEKINKDLHNKALEYYESKRNTENSSEKPNNCETQTDELREAKILLKASRDLLNKQNETIYVLNLLEETVEYHGAECDGYCLIDDIDDWLWQTEPQTEEPR